MSSKEKGNRKKSVLEWISFFFEKVVNFFIVFLLLDGTLFIFWLLHFKLLMWSQFQHPVFYSVIIALSFIYLIASLLYVGRKNFYKDFDKTRILGILFPLIMIVAIVGITTNCFAALSSILHDYKYISFKPELRKHDFNGFMNFYLWHFCDLIPQLKFNETLQWDFPYKATSSLQNWLLLFFKIIMVWIVIENFYKWNKWRKEEKESVDVSKINKKLTDNKAAANKSFVASEADTAQHKKK